MKEEQEKERIKEKKELEDLKKNMEEVRRMSEPIEDQVKGSKVEVQDAMVSSQEIRNDQDDEVVEITEENIGRLSKLYKGLLRNPNGTYSITPLYKTWNGQWCTILRKNTVCVCPYSLIVNL